MLRIGLASVLIVCLGSVACSDSGRTPTTSGPTTVAAAAGASGRGVLTLRIGTVVNSSAPTSERDQRTVQALKIAAEQASRSIDATVETVTIGAVDDTASAVAALAGRGVTVIVGTCDESTTGALLEAATDAGLLAVTGCAALPRPSDLGEPRSLFLDLASLHDAAHVMARYFVGQGLTRAAVLRSTLVGDIEETCLAFERNIANLGGTIVLSGAFSEVLESPEAILASSTDQLVGVEAVAVCALPPVLDETVATIRAAGYDQPVLIPWFGADATWSTATSDVVVFAASASDDPEPAVLEFFDALGDDANSADIIVADAVRVLVAAARRTASVGSLRLETMLLEEELDGATGPLRIDPTDRRPVGRAYRVIEVDRGRGETVELLTAAG